MILYLQISFLHSRLNTEVTEPQSYKKTIYIKLINWHYAESFKLSMHASILSASFVILCSKNQNTNELVNIISTLGFHVHLFNTLDIIKIEA